MRLHGYRWQRTIGASAEVHGVGFLTGAMVRLRFVQAPPSTGVVFVRTDLRPRTFVPARIDQVTGTQRRTTLGQPPAHVALVEHVLAALAGLRIDNCYVELNAPEPPGLDGSAQRFVEVLSRTPPVVQAVRREILSVDAPVIVTQKGATLTLHPAIRDELRISYLLDYGKDSPIGWQVHTQTLTPGSFTAEVAGCRTFILESEVLELRRQGLGARTTAADLLVFGKHGPIDNELRFANEPARHKILDIVGDLSLLGCELRGHLVAYRSGHPLNVELVRCLGRGACQELAP
ncbi:MAG TPA: UDP-3-O-acyl-N-acetylglucosamine deacetylase, partial [Gemmataceae bacterium]|nr:UDP-3-O-acyl-N-acetylglucosamine deacetylase [Gemmataceae bacterium]